MDRFVGAHARAGRHSVRNIALGLVLVLALVATAGCTWVSGLAQAQAFPSASAQPVATGFVVPSPSSYSLATPAATCPSSKAGRVLADSQWVFQLTMPSTWRSLRPGDAGWVTMYQQHGTVTEQQVSDGYIQDYAVPLEDESARNDANLTVYVDSMEGDEKGLYMEAVNYADVIRRATKGDATAVDFLALPAGQAVRIVGTHPDPDQPDWLWHLTAYLLYHGEYRYSLVLVAPEAKATTYAPIFDCIATSLQFLPARPTATNNRQPQALDN